MNPKVTVLLTVYNGEKYLSRAIYSILKQTFEDFEFLIINDGSVDNSLEIINSYRDSRIKIVNQANQGFVASLNQGLLLATGEYIARMDQDDISLPRRLAEQVAFMDRHPEVGICGTWAQLIDNEGRPIRKATYPWHHESMKAMLLFNSPLCHPSVMFRQAVLEVNNLHYQPFKTEDFDLWVRAVKMTKFANVPKFLFKYRFGVGFTATFYKNQCDQCFTDIVNQQVLALTPEATAQDLQIHRAISDFNYQPDRAFALAVVGWLKKIRVANAQRGLYDAKALDFVLAREWWAVCKRLDKKIWLASPMLWLNSVAALLRLNGFYLLIFLRMLVKF